MRPVETYAVFDPEDRLHGSICHGAEEVREIINQFACPEGLTVIRMTVDEIARDVTDEFITTDDEDTAFGIPSPDSLRRWHERRAL